MPEIDETTAQLARLIPKMFIQRRTDKAVQIANGEYRPIREPWKMGDFVDHLQKTKTFGHYTCDSDGMTKLLTFDLDLEKEGTWIEEPSDDELAEMEAEHEFFEKIVVHESRPREDFRDRNHPGRNWYKYQLRQMVDVLASGILRQLDIKTVSAYSGHKGCHVYGFFDEPVEAAVARDAAMVVLDFAAGLLVPGGMFKPLRGKNFYQLACDDPYYNLTNITIEVFPKQDSMADKDLGNLVRLPLGMNHKGTFQLPSGKQRVEPTFLIDQTRSQRELVPHPMPVWLLENGNPFMEIPK